jgi:hypothetical protein
MQEVSLQDLVVGKDYYIHLTGIYAENWIQKGMSMKAIGRFFLGLVSMDVVWNTPRMPRTIPPDAFDHTVPKPMMATFSNVEPIPSQKEDCRPCHEVAFGWVSFNNSGYKFYEIDPYNLLSKQVTRQIVSADPDTSTGISDKIGCYVKKRNMKGGHKSKKRGIKRCRRTKHRRKSKKEGRKSCKSRRKSKRRRSRKHRRIK